MRNGIVGALALLLCGCLENEEVIEVNADGSVHVVVAAHGSQMQDLADGYPVPLSGVWSARNEDTEQWLARVGPDTGGALAQEKAGANPWLDQDGKPRDVRLEVEATFGDISQIPETFAPENEPYRDAYSTRSAALRIERRGGRRVYLLERVFHRRDYRNVTFAEWLQRNTPKELEEAVKDSKNLTDAQWNQLVKLVQDALVHTHRALVERTLVEIYVHSDSSLPTQEWKRIVDSVVEAALKPASAERLSMIRRLSDERDRQPSHLKGENPFEELEEEMRARLREQLTSSLDSAGLPLKVRNAVLERLERHLTDMGHTDDLGDESFKIKVRMPGTIVGGNYDSVDGATASFSFQGEDLRDRDVRLQVVSVVD